MVMVAAGGWCMFVSCGCLQRTVAAGVVWQRSVRCGTASEDGTCGINIVGRVGLQRTMAGRSARLGYPVWYIVGRCRKRLLWFTDMATEVLCAGEVRRRGRPVTAAQLFDGVLGLRSNIAHHPDGNF
jgi:hypothetical protein